MEMILFADTQLSCISFLIAVCRLQERKARGVMHRAELHYKDVRDRLQYHPLPSGQSDVHLTCVRAVPLAAPYMQQKRHKQKPRMP